MNIMAPQDALGFLCLLIGGLIYFYGGSVAKHLNKNDEVGKATRSGVTKIIDRLLK